MKRRVDWRPCDEDDPRGANDDSRQPGSSRRVHRRPRHPRLRLQRDDHADHDGRNERHVVLNTVDNLVDWSGTVTSADGSVHYSITH